MKRSLRKLVLLLTLALPLLATADVASACPNCKRGNETQGDAVPRAYMYSILFMMSMPATILGGFAFGFYRLSKKAAVEGDSTDQLVE